MKVLETALIGATLLLTVACSDEPGLDRVAMSMTGGDPQRGRVLISQYGCNTCHTIPGVEGADATVGPPLDRVGIRTYIAGSHENTPQTMIRWIRNPKALRPDTAMPDTGASEADSRHMAAYLYTLR